MKYYIVILSFLLSAKSFATDKDSIAVASTLKNLASICKNVDFNDPQTFELGFFYKAASYIVYRGEDKSRNWKSPANYSNESEKKGVDDACERINQTINQDENYKIIGYATKAESEGVWHTLTASYIRKGVEKKTVYAFLKIGDSFLLGDID